MRRIIGHSAWHVEVSISISYSISIDIYNWLLSLNISWTHFHLTCVCYLHLLLHYSGSVDGAKTPCGPKPKMFTILTLQKNSVDLWSRSVISNYRYVLWKPYRYLSEKRGVDGGIQDPSTFLPRLILLFIQIN